MYEPAGTYNRTELELRDQDVAWARADRPFFAAGACHILTWAFLDTHRDQGYRPVGLRGVGEEVVWHVLATDDVWAFDFDGWTDPAELVATTSRFEGKDVEVVDLPESLEAFCAAHRHRRPDQYPHDPWPRAHAYLAQLPTAPPLSR